MRRRKASNFDDLIDDEEEGSNKTAKSSDIESENKRRVLIGRVDHFYDKINVAAIRLTGDLKIGDTIEIDDGVEKMRLNISSMQIDRNPISEASDGADVGIMVESAVSRGSKVYLII